MKIHLTAIGGSAMHNLALALQSQGHRVSGSDDEIFEPSRSRLAQAGLLPEKMGWDPHKIQADLDYLIVGMHARADNPELARAQALAIPTLSYPEYLYQACQNKTRVVIAGSHGKTTISAMVLHALHYHERECDYMLGAQIQGFDTMVKLTEDNEFVLLEGDEYLSSPLDRRPKFLHYQANIALLSGIAWDHVNVFPQYEDYRQQFALLLDSMAPGGVMIYNEDDPEVKKLVEEHTKEIKKFAYRLPEYRVENSQFLLQSPEGEIPLKIIGQHNMSNLEGARWICNQMGLTDQEFYEAIAEFEGASLRLESLGQGPKGLVYRDFAHAPSKVKASVHALRESAAEQHFCALLELHTFSSLNPDFLPQYAHSMDLADRAIVFYDPAVLAHKKLPPLSPDRVREAFARPDLEVYTDTESLQQALRESQAPEAAFLLMSSGNFRSIDWLAFFALQPK